MLAFVTTIEVRKPKLYECQEILVALTFHFNKFIEDPRGLEKKAERPKPMPVALKIQYNIHILFRCLRF